MSQGTSLAQKSHLPLAVPPGSCILTPHVGCIQQVFESFCPLTKSLQRNQDTPGLCSLLERTEQGFRSPSAADSRESWRPSCTGNNMLLVWLLPVLEGNLQPLCWGVKLSCPQDALAGLSCSWERPGAGEGKPRAMLLQATSVGTRLLSLPSSYRVSCGALSIPAEEILT